MKKLEWLMGDFAQIQTTFSLFKKSKHIYLWSDLKRIFHFSNLLEIAYYSSGFFYHYITITKCLLKGKACGYKNKVRKLI